MKARSLIDRRVILAPAVFAELVLWKVPAPVVGSSHDYKYRMALIVDGLCVLRYDNEAGKGDHVHYSAGVRFYHFQGVDRLIADFETDVLRWLDEHSNS